MSMDPSLPSPSAAGGVAAADERASPVPRRLEVEWGNVGFQCALRQSLPETVRALSSAASSEQYPLPMKPAGAGH